MPDGPPGTGTGFFNGGVLTGTGAPSNSLGSNGNLYVNLSNGSVYSKSSGSWAVLAGGGAGVSNLLGIGSPVGVVTPDALGQFYTDRTTPGQPIVWQATGLTNADWERIT